MAAMKPSLGRVLPGSSILFLCDMQEKFRHVMYFPQIVSMAARMLKVARMLEIPAVLTEQYPQGLGPTVPELGAEGLRALPKTCLSMVPVVRQELDARPQLRSVLLCGIEAQACILNTALDLLDRGLQVHVVVDACSSRRWTGWWHWPGCGRAGPSSPPVKGSFCSLWVMPPTPVSKRSRRSSRSRSRTLGCWASSKARTPSSSELLTLPGGETTLLSLGWGKRFPPILGSQEWCNPPGVPPPREGRRVLPCHWVTAPGNANESPGSWAGVGRAELEAGLGPGPLQGAGKGGGVTDCVGPGLAE
uniref:Isochorismatase domain containing 2 n=1 Tax=Equus asinus TaxID=9793 RepID=A0A8C4MPW5_EQUAS